MMNGRLRATPPRIAAAVAVLVTLVALWAFARTWQGQPPGFVTAIWSSSSEGVIEPGEEVFAIDPNIIVGIDYETPERKMVANRSGDSEGSFHVAITQAGSGKVEHCRAATSLGPLVSALASIRAVRVLSAREADTLQDRYGSTAATLRIRDTIETDAKEFRVLMNREANPALVFAEGDSLFVPSMPPEVMAPLGMSCAKLSGARPD